MGQKRITVFFFWPKQIEMVKEGYMINMYSDEQDICVYICMYTHICIFMDKRSLFWCLETQMISPPFGGSTASKEWGHSHSKYVFVYI